MSGFACPKCLSEEARVKNTSFEHDNFVLVRSYQCANGHRFKTWELSESVMKHFGTRQIELRVQTVKSGVDRRTLAEARKKSVANLRRHGLSKTKIALEMNLSHQRISQIFVELDQEKE